MVFITYSAIWTFELKKDIYQTVILGNDFTEEKYSFLNLTSLNFMPYFEIRLLKELDPKFDIYDDTQTDNVLL